MTGWAETYRGAVAPWECDVTEHFTIAYYFDRLEQAEVNLAARLGLGETLRRGGFPRRFDLRFARELRAGTTFHLDGAALGIDGGGLRLGHRVVDSVTGQTVTWIEERWDAAVAVSEPQRAAIGAQAAAWDGPAVEQRPQPKDTAGFAATARGRARPGDLDQHGRFGLAAFVHKFTDASMQIGAMVGLTADYIKTARRGFSTFELALELRGDLAPGDPFVIETALAHLGGSSLRFVHVMSNPDSGREIARLGQFGVQLDLDARRPAALSGELRARAQQLAAAVG